MIIIPGPVVRGSGVSIAIGVDFVTGTTDAYGTMITSAPSVGWYGSPAMRHPGRADRPGAHGSFASTGYSEGRSIQIGGKGLAVDAQSAIRSIRALRAVLADGQPDTLTWFDPDEDVVLSAVVERDGEVQIRFIGDRNFQWQMSLWAPDHRVYGEPVSATTRLPGGGTGLTWPIGSFFDFGDPGSTGQIWIQNTGTAPTEPTITVTGPLAAGFQITEVSSGRRLRYPAPVVTDVLIDCAAGTASSGGQDRTGLLTADDFFTIPGNESRTYQFATLGSETATSPATATMAAAPAYY